MENPEDLRHKGTKTEEGTKAEERQTEGTKAEKRQTEGTKEASVPCLTASVAICNPDIELFRKFIASLKKYTPELAHLIIIDNASGSKEFREIIKEGTKAEERQTEGTKEAYSVPQCLSA